MTSDVRCTVKKIRWHYRRITRVVYIKWRHFTFDRYWTALFVQAKKS